LDVPKKKDDIITDLTLKQDKTAWVGLKWLWVWRVPGCSEHGNTSSGSIKCGKFLE
jgi:hypothetical protein